MFVGVIGPNASNCTMKQYDFGLELGKVVMNLGNYPRFVFGILS